MATPEQVAELRRKISEPDDVAPYTDEILGALIDAAEEDVDSVASAVWSEKASMYSEMVDISEAGSSRKNSQLMSNAIEMARFYGARGESDIVAGRDFPTTRRIVRAD